MVGGVALYCGEETDKLFKPPFKRHFFTEYNNRKIGIGYYSFPYRKADKFPEFDYFCWGNFGFHRTNGKTKFYVLCEFPPFLTYLSYKRFYKKIRYYNEKYKDIKNDFVVNFKTKILGMERLRYCNNEKAYTMPFALYTPETCRGEKYPLVIYLHGYRNGGETNRVHGAKYVVNECKKNMKESPCFIVVPSLPKYERYVTGPEKEKSGEISTLFDGIFTEFLETLCNRNPIDKNRIYIIGNSDGAGGVWAQLRLHPERYATAIPMMGFSFFDTPDFYNSIKDIPVWAVHAEDDTVVAIGKGNHGSFGSDIIVEGIKTAGGTKIKYSRYTESGHGASVVYLREENWHSWLFSQNKKSY